jgi:hypothetical protein
MKKDTLRELLDSHSLIVGAALDGKIIWVCLDSGNFLLTQHGGGPVESWKNPTRGSLCNSLSCKHILLGKIKRVKDMEHALQTLNHRKEQIRAKHAVDQNQQYWGAPPRRS